MKSSMNDSVLPRAPWLGLLILLGAVVFLSGCKSYGPIGTPNFDPSYSRTLEKNEQLLYAARTELMIGTYMEGEEELFPLHPGMLLLTSERMMFAPWNEKQQRYEPTIWTDYPHIAQVKMHNNILLQYIAIIATDGNKFTYMLNPKSADAAYAVLMEKIGKSHPLPKPAGPST